MEWAGVLWHFLTQTHNLVLLRKISDRHKLRDAIFICRNRPACFPDVEIRKAWGV